MKKKGRKKYVPSDKIIAMRFSPILMMLMIYFLNKWADPLLQEIQTLVVQIVPNRNAENNAAIFV